MLRNFDSEKELAMPMKSGLSWERPLLTGPIAVKQSTEVKVS